MMPLSDKIFMQICRYLFALKGRPRAFRGVEESGQIMGSAPFLSGSTPKFQRPARTQYYGQLGNLFCPDQLQNLPPTEFNQSLSSSLTIRYTIQLNVWSAIEVVQSSFQLN